MKIEKTEIWITCERALQFSDGRTLRGFFDSLASDACPLAQVTDTDIWTYTDFGRGEWWK